MKRSLDFTCIGCPMGCQVTIVVDEKGNIDKVTGHECKDGKKFVQSEYANPVRVLTTTVLVEGSKRRTLPVRTSKPIPKERLREVMSALARIRVKPPVKMGQTIISNVLNTGGDVIATDLIAE